jgi:hypothetical protein
MTFSARCHVYDVTTEFGVYKLLSKHFCTLATFLPAALGRKHFAFMTYKVLKDIYMFMIKFTEE